MTLQVLPVTIGEGFTDAGGNALRDLPFLAPTNESLRPIIRFRPVLDGSGFQISMMWQQLSQTWILRQLLTRDGDTVTLGIVLGGSGQDLLKPISNVLRPAGQLWYGFDGGRLGRPQRFSWREKAKMYYRPSALVAVLRGSDRAML